MLLRGVERWGWLLGGGLLGSALLVLLLMLGDGLVVEEVWWIGEVVVDVSENVKWFGGVWGS